MMDKSAIEQIQKHVVADSLNNNINLQESLVPVLAIPNDFEIESLEQFYPNRARFRGRFETNHIEDFVKYTRESGGHCFVDPEGMCAKSIMDLGTVEKPGHAQHTAVLTLKKTTPLADLLRIDGMHGTQQGIAEWLEDWRDILRAEDSAGEEIGLRDAIGAIRKITIATAREYEHATQSLSQSRSTMEKIEAKSKNANMPAFFYFTCTPYEQLQEREFMLRLSIITTGDTIGLKLRIARLEAIKEEVAEEFRDKLLEELDASNTEIYIGTFNAL